MRGRLALTSSGESEGTPPEAGGVQRWCPEVEAGGVNVGSQAGLGWCSLGLDPGMLLSPDSDSMVYAYSEFNQIAGGASFSFMYSARPWVKA